MRGAAIMNRQRARLNEPSAARTTSRTATIIRFPFALTAHPAGRDGWRRPSLALNIVLIVLLVLACVVWEAISARKEHAHEPHGTPVTSPRAAALQDVA
jgi:hypothetical protein